MSAATYRSRGDNHHHNDFKREQFLIIDDYAMPGPSNQSQLAIQSNNIQHSIRYKNLSSTLNHPKKYFFISSNNQNAAKPLESGVEEPLESGVEEPLESGDIEPLEKEIEKEIPEPEAVVGETNPQSTKQIPVEKGHQNNDESEQNQIHE